MNEKELKQVKVLEKLVQKEITQREASLRLDFSVRWIREKSKRYKKEGEKGLIHLSRGRQSTRQWKEEERARMIELLKDEWHGFGPTFVAEKLQELENIHVSKETVRQAMIAAKLWDAHKQKIRHRKRRERRAMLGMMVQLDGSPHDWFEGRGPRCTLLVFIDDATSKILWLEFVESESVNAVMRATKQYISTQGIARELYVDHGSVFHVNLNNKEHIKITQWERAMTDLGINVIHAHSPQAKGRVERCNKTMQDRLIKEMRLAQISSITQANEFICTGNFVQKHNQKFAVPPAQQGNAHKDASRYKLDHIFSLRDERTLANDWTITFNKQIFQLDKHQLVILRPKDVITVITHLDGSINLSVRRIKLNFYELLSKSRKESIEKQVSNTPRKPSKNSRRWVGGLFPPESRVKPAPPAVEASLS